MDQLNLESLPRDFFDGDDVEAVAKALIGTFIFTKGSQRTGGKIVETEAYDENDPAAHCHPGADKRRRIGSDSMLLKGGHAYIYSSRINVPADPKKQMWCLNFVTGKNGVCSAVLIRALQPICGLETMQQRRIQGAPETGPLAKILRSNNYIKHLCNGPAILCEALDITNRFDRSSLFDDQIELYARDAEHELLCGPRVGVTKGAKASRPSTGRRYARHRS